jgi:pimeloyl-ACP methyl ester carboxylesterase/DNA-binding CsgD family transcriptional regulator
LTHPIPAAAAARGFARSGQIRDGRFRPAITLPLVVQSIRFVDAGGRRVAVGTVGQGPPVIIGGWWMSHLEHDWRDPAFRRFVAALGRHRTLIRYDRPGTGLSADGDDPPGTLAGDLEVLSGVFDSLGLERAGLYAASSGGPVACAFAAERPDAVERLVLWGSYASGGDVADEAARESILGIVRSHWGLGSRVLADVLMPTAGGAERTAFAAYQRDVATPELAATALESVYSFDVRDLLGRIDAPTSVIHRSADTAIPARLGAELAAAIPGATLTTLDGSEHFAWRGDAAAAARAILAGLGVAGAEVDIESEPERTDPEPGATDLTERELEVLRLVALGRSDREIAEELVLSPHTVHRHVANIRTKLRLPSRAAAAAHAARLGLL